MCSTIIPSENDEGLPYLSNLSPTFLHISRSLHLPLPKMLLLLVLVPLVLGDTCPPPSPLYSCATPSLYIMDATNDVDSATINAVCLF